MVLVVRNAKRQERVNLCESHLAKNGITTVNIVIFAGTLTRLSRGWVVEKLIIDLNSIVINTGGKVNALHNDH